MAVPENIEPCVERRYFSVVRYCAFTCDNEHISERLRQRPAWRGSDDDAFVESNIEFNEWLKNHGISNDPPITLIDTSDISVEDAAEQLERWIADNRFAD